MRSAMRTTKIVATIGPATSTRETLSRIVDQGVDVIRFNMSHGAHAEHKRALDLLTDIAAERGVHIARMADLCGPKVRTGSIDASAADIGPGDRCLIVQFPIEGTAARFSTNTPALVDDIRVGHRVLIDDGSICLRVEEKSSDGLVCVCEIGGTIGSQKGINVPDSQLTLSTVTDKDHADMAWAAANDFDFLALSFVRSAEDVVYLRSALERVGSRIPIISKIETPQAIDALDTIIEVSDGVLVARGDLGVEMDVSRIPMLQKMIVRRCREMGKPVIVATQMLHTMVDQPVPTRAEVSDVANAVFEGADAVMLSAETAVGRYPAEAVSMMNKICVEASTFRVDQGMRRNETVDEWLRVGHTVDETRCAVARSAVLVSHDLGANLLAVWCRSGRTAQWMSMYRSATPLVSLSSCAATCRRMALSFGITPLLLSESFVEGSLPWRDLQGDLVDQFSLNHGEFIVVVGDPEAPDRTSTLAIHLVNAE